MNLNPPPPIIISGKKKKKKKNSHLAKAIGGYQYLRLDIISVRRLKESHDFHPLRFTREPVLRIAFDGKIIIERGVHRKTRYTSSVLTRVHGLGGGGKGVKSSYSG